MGKSRIRKNAGNNSQSHSLLPHSLSPSPSALLPPPLSPKIVQTRADSFKKLFGINNTMDSNVLEDQEFNAVFEEVAPPTAYSACPEPDEEDLGAMSMDEILRGMESFKVFSNKYNMIQKVMQVSLDDHATAIEIQKSSTDLLSTQVEELRSELTAVKDQLAQQSLRVNRAERLSNRAHSNRMHESLRADQKVLLLNDVTPMVEDQSQAPLSTLNRSQFRDSFRACLSVVLKQQNVSISLLPLSKLLHMWS